MYKLNKNSNASKFYSWIWSTDVSKFKTMCPYFWRYVLTILLLPIALFIKLIDMFAEYLLTRPSKTRRSVKTPRLIRSVGNKIKNISKQPKVVYYANKAGSILAFTLLGGIGLFLLAGIVYAAFMHTLEFLASIGATTLLVGAVIGVVHLAASYNIGKPFVVTGKAIAFPFRVTGNMISAIYKNICPIIKWES